MGNNKKNTIGSSSFAIGLIALLISAMSTISVCTIPAIGATAPFSFEISPRTVTAKPGDVVSFHASVNATSGFSDSIAFTLAISAPVYSTTLTLGTVSPPYPRTYDFSVKIPSEIPVSITAEGVVTGTSGSSSQTETIQITIEQPSGGGFFDSIIKAFTDFWNWLMRLLGRG